VGRDKYSTAHSLATNIFIPDSIHHNSAALIRASLSTSSWNKHLSAINCFFEFERKHNEKFSWPLEESVICDFVSYALLTRQLKQTTVKDYLSSIAFYHKLRNLDSSACSSFIASTMMKGAKNMELYTDITKQTRKIMTYPLLKILSHQIFVSDMSDHDKQVFWTLFTTAFFGSFRFGELVYGNINEFNPREDLIWSDIRLEAGSVTYRLKVTKNKTPLGEYVDLFVQPENKYCPVKAIHRLRDMVNPIDLNKPVFTLSNRSLLTVKAVNDTLFKLLEPLIGGDASLITGHSFRAALPSVMASCPDIASQEDIQKWGRWSSDSYLLYTRLKMRQKKLIFAKIVSALNVMNS
jgi:hypothetical protein